MKQKLSTEVLIEEAINLSEHVTQLYNGNRQQASDILAFNFVLMFDYLSNHIDFPVEDIFEYINERKIDLKLFKKE